MPAKVRTAGEAPKIATLLRPRQRFMRSIFLERDFNDGSALEGYIVTPEIRRIAGRILRAADPDSRQRAWRITGDYGSGKSSLAILLAQTLAKGISGLPKPVSSALRLKGHVADGASFVPLLVTGTRRSVRDAILESLIAAFAGLSRTEPKFLGRAQQSLRKGAVDDGLVLAIIEDALEYLSRRSQGGGIVLILDELGKFLEFALMNPQHQDVYFLQQLAELASRSGDTPFMVIGLLHQGFSSYVGEAPVDTQREWEKICGRFEEVVLRPTAIQELNLAAAALHLRRNQLPTEILEFEEQALAQALRQGLFPGGDDGTDRLDVGGIYPLNPAAFAILSRLFRHFGQNERSLFSFMFAGETKGLSEFAEQSTLGEVYTAHHVFDYVRANMAHRLRQEAGTRWAMIEDLVTSFVSDDQEEIHALKAVAVLNLLDAQGLRATPAVVELAQAFPGSKTGASSGVRQALNRLTEQGILHRRGAQGDFCLWPYTSLDLRQRRQDAQSAVGELRSVVPILLEDLATRPLVARRHYIETGNLRAMSVVYASLLNAARALEREHDRDGRLLVILCESVAEQEQALAFVRSSEASADSRTLYAVTRPLKDLAPLVQEQRRWLWVSENSPEVANDRFAEREISKMLDVSRQHLSDALDQILGFRRLTGQSQGASWFYKGAAVELPSTRSLLGQLSQIFDEVYHLAPRVKNELVNRDHLSSAAAAARMRLIERVYEHPSSELLGMDPTRKPPEMSMYLSVLKAAELHRKSSDGFEFALPRRSHDPCHVTPVFEMILRVLQQAGESKVALPVLAQALREPPYGLRDGLFLLFFAVFLALHEQDVALYEDGGFVRRVTGPEFARMAKRMDEFEVQYCRIAGVRREVFQRLLQMLTRDGQTLENTAEVTVLDIVRPMMSFLAGLPDFARQTRSLTEPCLRVRTVLIAAREPGALLFQELPQALGFPPFTATGRPSKGDNVEEFVETLRAALNELREAYPTLLARQTAELCKAFELPETTTAELRETLARRAQRLVFAVREPSLRALCMRLSDTKLGDDAWLEALGSLICAKPPGRWTDSDEVRFRDGLGLRATHFQSAESLVFPGDSAMPQQERAVRLSVMLQDGVQVERVIRLNPQDAGHVDELRARMTELLGGRDRKVSLAALSEVLLAFLDMQQDGGGQSAPGGA